MNRLTIFSFLLLLIIASCQTTEIPPGAQTARNGAFIADASFAVPATLKQFDMMCPIVEKLRGWKIQVNEDGLGAQIIEENGDEQNITLHESYNSWKSRGMACLRGMATENGRKIKLSLCAKFKTGNGLSPTDWRNKGVYVEENGKNPKINVGSCALENDRQSN